MKKFAVLLSVVLVSVFTLMSPLVMSNSDMAIAQQQTTTIVQNAPKEAIPVALAPSPSPVNPFEVIVGRFEAEGANPVFLWVEETQADGRIKIKQYKFRGNELPVKSAQASLSGIKDRPIRLDITAGVSDGVKFELYYSDTFGGMLRGPVQYGERRGEATLIRQKK